MRIIYNNLVDELEDSAIVVASENSQYPKENMQDIRLAIAYRTTSITSQSVVFNLGSAQSINTFAILGHNITTSATITVSANSSDSWPGATTETITGNENVILKFFSESHSYQYWKVSIDDSTNTDSYLEIGKIWLGEYTQVSPSSLINFTITKKRDDEVVYGKGRQKFSQVGIGWREFVFTFPRTEYVMLEKIQSIYDTVGRHTPFIFCNFDTDRSYKIVEPCYCSFNSDIVFNHINRMKFEYTLSFEEDL